MAKSRKNQQKSTVMVVEQGANWRIERERGSTDFLAIVDEVGTIGYCKTQTEARMLISSYNCPEVS
jgi:hypothetical protein